MTTCYEIKGQINGTFTKPGPSSGDDVEAPESAMIIFPCQAMRLLFVCFTFLLVSTWFYQRFHEKTIAKSTQRYAKVTVNLTPSPSSME